MSGASIIFRAHVPGRDLNRFLDREPVAVRTCARLRWRAHSDLTNAQTPPVTHRVAVIPNSGNVVASILPVWRKLRRTVELTQAPVLRTFSSPYRGRVWRLICNLLPVQVHTGQCFSFLRVAFVNDCRQPANSIARTFSFAPVQVLSSFALCHVRNMKQKDARSHEQCTREYE
jgi:hypothetical protein